jgi:hypothetical protein
MIETSRGKEILTGLEEGRKILKRIEKALRSRE